MFSGIVAGTGKIISLKSNKDFMTLKVDPPKGFCKGLQKVRAFPLMVFV